MTLDEIKTINNIISQMNQYKESLCEIEHLTHIDLGYNGYGASFMTTSDKDVVFEVKKVLKRHLEDMISKAEGRLRELGVSL